MISGVELDVWVYPRVKIEAPHDAYEFLQIWDGIIISDETGLLSSLQTEVREYIHSTANKGAGGKPSESQLVQEDAGANRTRRL